MHKRKFMLTEKIQFENLKVTKKLMSIISPPLEVN